MTVVAIMILSALPAGLVDAEFVLPEKVQGHQAGDGD
jgi:hypothetical protein